MVGPQAPDPAPPEEKAPAERRERRQNRWLLAVTVLAVIAAGAAGYAISEIENTKDENREGSQAVNAVRADLEVLREQTTERLDTVEGRVDDAADDASLRRLENSLQEIRQQVRRLDGADDEGDLATRIDELEQRVEELEQDAN